MSTPLIALARINRFFLLQELLGEIKIPQAVYSEVVMLLRYYQGFYQDTKEALYELLDQGSRVSFK